MQHISVLLQESIAALNIKPDGVYLDGTFGRGGHSRLILSRLGERGRLLALDRDAAAVAVGRDLAAQDARFSIQHRPFSELSAAVADYDFPADKKQFDGVLLDLGISSPQIDEAARGFSFRFDAPLDMRMDQTRGQTAAQWLAQASAGDIQEVLWNYGEERFARQIAAAIVETRKTQPIQTTGELARLCAACVRTREPNQNPATRSFQAIRIFINRELEELDAVLPQALDHLALGGRLAVISFHSLEDRRVKQFMQTHAKAPSLPRWAMLRDDELPMPPLRLIGRGQTASAEELAQNPRARSARLRVAERQVSMGNFIK